MSDYIKLKISSYQIGEISLLCNQYIIRNGKLLYFSLFGREIEVRAFVAGFFESYMINVYPKSDDSGHYGYSNNCYRDNFKYSTMHEYHSTENHQKFIHEIVYAKELININALIISNDKDELRKQLWKNIEENLKDIPIPNFAKETVWKEYENEFTIAGDDDDCEFYQFGLDDYVIAYNNIKSAQLDRKNMHDLIINCRPDNQDKEVVVQ